MSKQFENGPVRLQFSGRFKFCPCCGVRDVLVRDDARQFKNVEFTCSLCGFSFMPRPSSRWQTAIANARAQHGVAQ